MSVVYIWSEVYDLYWPDQYILLLYFFVTRRRSTDFNRGDSGVWWKKDRRCWRNWQSEHFKSKSVFFLSVTSSNMLLAIIVSILIANLSIKRKTKTRLTLNIGNDKGPPYCFLINNLINAWLVEFNVALTVNHKSTDPKEF